MVGKQEAQEAIVREDSENLDSVQKVLKLIADLLDKQEPSPQGDELIDFVSFKRAEIAGNVTFILRKLIGEPTEIERKPQVEKLQELAYLHPYVLAQFILDSDIDKALASFKKEKDDMNANLGLTREEQAVDQTDSFNEWMALDHLKNGLSGEETTERAQLVELLKTHNALEILVSLRDAVGKISEQKSHGVYERFKRYVLSLIAKIKNKEG